MADRRPGRQRQRRRAQGISGVQVENYKTLSDSGFIRLGSLTVLAGANSSGKSSLLQPLLLLKQTLETPFDAGAILLDGPNVSLSHAGKVLTRSSADRGLRVRLYDNAPESILDLQYELGPEARGFNIAHMSIVRGDKTMTLREGMSSDRIERELNKIESGQANRYLEIFANTEEEEVARPKFSVIRNRCFYGVQIEIPQTDRDRSRRKRSPVTVSVTLPDPVELRNLSRAIRSLIHLPGLRGNPERTYRATAVSGQFPGSFNDYVASLIAHWSSTDRDALRGLWDDLRTLNLTWKVEARPTDDTHVELMVGRMTRSRRGGARDLVNIADVGFGLSQSLPVLVALRVAENRQVVYLEQPEIHLHPRAQANLARVILGAIERGVQVIVETHSAILIRALQAHVARGDISANDIEMHWFDREPETGFTRIDTAEIGDDGSFGEWPSDFDEVSLAVEREYLDAVVARNV